MLSVEGLAVLALLLVCSCAFARANPRARAALLTERHGFWGIFHKGAVLGVAAAVALIPGPPPPRDRSIHRRHEAAGGDCRGVRCDGVLARRVHCDRY